MLNLRRYLYRLFENDRRHTQFYAILRICLLYTIIQMHIQCRRIRENIYRRGLSCKILETILNVIINLYLNTISQQFAETVFSFSINNGRILLHKPFHKILGHKQIRYHQRIIINVRTPDIQQPGDLIKGRNEHPVHLIDEHPFTQPLDLLLTRYAAKALHIKGRNRTYRHLRPLLP